MRRRLAINSLGHFIVDALCACTLFGRCAEGDMLALTLLYNTLAFSTQCAVGLITDRLRRHMSLGAAALIAVAAGFVLPLPAYLRIALAGLGNSLFHVAGGTVTLTDCEGRAGPLGIFVAPGALGLAIGTLYPALGGYFALAAVLCAAFMLRRAFITPTPERGGANTPWLAAIALLLAVAVRAVGGSAVSLPWKSGALLTIITVCAVVLGKCAGGYVCDRLGASKTALLSIPAAALLAAFCGAYMLPSLLGQLLVNLTMPVTLFLIYRAMPDAPGLAFGLAASALWPGTLLGNLIELSGAYRAALVLLCFALGLAAIIYADKAIKMEVQK